MPPNLLLVIHAAYLCTPPPVPFYVLYSHLSPFLPCATAHYYCRSFAELLEVPSGKELREKGLVLPHRPTQYSNLSHAGSTLPSHLLLCDPATPPSILGTSLLLSSSLVQTEAETEGKGYCSAVPHSAPKLPQVIISGNPYLVGARLLDSESL